MPFGAAQILIELIDYDDGDLGWLKEENYQLWEYLQERLVLFKFHDRTKGKDRLEMTLRNDDHKLIDNPIFAKGQKFLISWGWTGNMTPPRRVVVQKVIGRDQIVVKCHCRLALMDRDKVSRFEENMTDSEFVRKVAAEYGYTGQYLHIDETTIRHDIVQNYRTDARFLNYLARKNHFDFYIDFTGLHWHERRTNMEPVKTYIYKNDPGVGDILDVPKFEVNLTRAVAKVKVVARDPRTKKEIIAYGGPNETEMENLGFEDEMGDPDDSDQGRRAGRMARYDVRGGGLMSQEEAQREADARYMETAKKKYKMEMSVIGDPKVRAKRLVDYWGMADLMNGFYYLKEVVHVIEGGKFTQILKGEKDALGKLNTAKKIGRKKSPNPIIRLDDTTIYGDIAEELQRMLTVKATAEGNIIPAWTYGSSGGGAYLGDLQPGDLSGLSDATLDRLFQEGAQSAPPDADM